MKSTTKEDEYIEEHGKIKGYYKVDIDYFYYKKATKAYKM
jgi:hypothetical protein